MDDPVFRTDQDRCFASDGEIVPCEGTGQDGETRAGRPWPTPRFEATDERVRDRLTGLVWTRNANPAEFPLSWDEALEFVAAMNEERTSGHAGWRLPNRRELFGLISHARVNPALPADHPFENVFPGYYWSGTTVARLPDQAWYLHLGGARLFKGMKHGSYMVWPVRGGGDGDLPPEGPGPDPRMVPDGETVFDRWTGRSWTRNADLAGGLVAWEGALARVAELNAERAGGFADWRLPSIRELESVTDPDAHSPAVAGAERFERLLDFYWSSTTSVYDPAYAWTFYARDGILGVGYKANPEFGVWAVRGGTIETGARPGRDDKRRPGAIPGRRSSSVGSNSAG